MPKKVYVRKVSKKKEREKPDDAKREWERKRIGWDVLDVKWKRLPGSAFSKK